MSSGQLAPMEIRIPRMALWLGLAGLLPFLTGAAAVWSLAPERLLGTTLAVVTYGAVVLSFLGGVHWGLAAPAGRPLQLGFSVMPALVAWIALLAAHLPAVESALWLLAAAFAILLLCDLAAAGQQLTPGWYPRLRLPLSLAVVASLIASALA